MPFRGEKKKANRNKHSTELVNMEIERFIQPAAAFCHIHISSFHCDVPGN